LYGNVNGNGEEGRGKRDDLWFMVKGSWLRVMILISYKKASQQWG